MAENILLIVEGIGGIAFLGLSKDSPPSPWFTSLKGYAT